MDLRLRLEVQNHETVQPNPKMDCDLIECLCYVAVATIAVLAVWKFWNGNELIISLLLITPIAILVVCIMHFIWPNM